VPLTRSRYDGCAGWYGGRTPPHAERNAAGVLDLPGPGEGLCLGLGEGLCLGLGCGCSRYFDALAATGRTAIGLGRSAGQLRITQGRCRRIVPGTEPGGGRMS